MNWSRGLNLEEQSVINKKWHSCFAWLPVEIEKKYHWLETVERSGTLCMADGYFWTWEYRLPQ